MVTKKLGGSLPVFVLCVLVLLAFPVSGAAQTTSTFVIPFERTTDPVLDEQGNNVGGAFVNPCTFENVDVAGSSTLTVYQGVKDRKGLFIVKVGTTTKGTGLGWVGDSYAAATFTGSSYVFLENQEFRVVVPSLATGQYFESLFTDKFNLKGAGPVDNWVIRAYYRLKIDSKGIVQVFIDRLNADGCKG